jgi:hypothetical protein
MPIKSAKNKGSGYEREVAKFFKENFECDAFRSQQYCGKNGDADVSINIPIHIECKRVESFSLYPALSQAKTDAPADKVPVVIHRKNNKPSVLIVELENLKKLVSTLYPKLKEAVTIETSTQNS